MKCDKARIQLAGLTDKALSAGENEAVRRHLATCDECRTLLERLRADAELLRQEPAPEVPAGLATRIMAEVRDRSARDNVRNPGIWVMSLATRVAAVVLVAVGIWLGTVLGRGIAGSQPSLAEQLAAHGVPVAGAGQ